LEMFFWRRLTIIGDIKIRITMDSCQLNWYSFDRIVFNCELEIFFFFFLNNMNRRHTFT
jgi:hypothetical protein